MSELMDIGKRIATIRKQRGKTQAWIAARLYISRQTVSLWEQGKAKPSVDLLPALCELLDVPVCALLGLCHMAKRGECQSATAEEAGTPTATEPCGRGSIAPRARVAVGGAFMRFRS
ncbi:MAG: helix-turn-helix transcriptional regulator [Clostridia bacterium]|nr:helix-turn-helix transcriptional regulator [Clostridia bacterium]